ncbi:GntR family transcriptional regulator [Bacillaceae bacterium]
MKQQPLFDNNSLSRLIAEKIAEQIMTGELQPGDKLVETVYAEEYGTSRAPIREALYLLTIEGLVERIPRKGAVVKGYNEREIYDILEIRMMLETLAMKRIAEFGTVESLYRRMEALIPRMEEAENDPKRYAELNREFHLMIIEMSRSEIIKNMYSRLGIPLLSLQRISFLEEGNIRKSLQEHRVILETLKRQAFAEALTILEKHNRAVKERVEQRVKGATHHEGVNQSR